MPNKRKEDLKMKKTTKKLVCAILSLVMLFSGMFSLTASALTEKLVEDHFDKLSVASHPYWNVSTPPSENTCAYTAMSMILSYYDAYWHKDFVPDDLDWNTGRYNLFNEELSRDQLNETFTAKSEYGQWVAFKDNGGSYYEFAIQTSNTYLESYLVSMGISKNLYDEPYAEFGLNPMETKAILEEYLLIQGLTSNEVVVNLLTIENYTVEQIKQTLKQQVMNGNPVICSCHEPDTTENDESANDNKEKSSGGHALVAYKMIENNTDIKMHTGWATEEFTTLNTTKYSELKAIVWIEIVKENLPHEHSYMHIDTHTDLPMCACEMYSTHPEHENNHVYVYHCDAERAYKVCHCGDEVELCVHTLNYTNNDDRHTAVCTKCFEIMNLDHSYNIPTNISNAEHRLDCICGHQGTETEAHYAHGYIPSGRLSHRVYCECGKMIGMEAHSMFGGASSATCIACGYIDENFSGNIIMGANGEEEKTIE